MMVAISNSVISNRSKVNCIVVLCVIFLSTHIIKSDIVRFMANFSAIFIIFKFKLQNSSLNSLVSAVVTYVLLLPVDIAIFMISLAFPHETIMLYPLIKSGTSNIVMGIFSYSIAKNRYIMHKISQLCQALSNKSNLFIIVLFSSQSIIVMSVIYINYFYNSDDIISGILVLILYGIASIAFIHEAFFKIRYREKSKVIEDIIADKDRIIDELSRNKHITLNSIIALRGMLDDDSEAAYYLDSMVGTKSTSLCCESLENLSNIPDKGLQYLIKYKIIDCINRGISVVTHVDRDAANFTICHDSQLIYDIYTVAGVILDNAVEAATDSELRQLGINAMCDDNSFIITVINSFRDKPNLSKIYNDGYSTKGKYRGKGLSIVKSIANRRKQYLSVILEVSNSTFVGKIVIKKREH